LCRYAQLGNEGAALTQTAFRARFPKSSILRQTAAFVHGFITKN
jgi:hypothetical protein